ncbi:MAG TPA: FAD-binding oxidoreductase [Deltaproteobacteria bacterium]|nr:FAD-binding oxidoreductase [Deltaproteobacteria bacterium]HNQ84671.1 FAD-binding oxidoreductase [Deltaproteobacteria bacterium]HNS88499.1 FAD-binding oxidoreductase [Deltaproteobacteria bacterium]HOA43403.1 FAD-binding oxidoreductase [Deltaproteobacteria bacterium]HOC74693.1 FAD-binding oxidoreductase [Deltaproteobacteria bacterium]
MERQAIVERLKAIVGEAYVSDAAEELFIYSRDQGVQDPHEPDWVVMPGGTAEVASVVELARAEKIPVVPMGGGLVLSGLSVPLRGGIVLDMKRMNRILEVNDQSHYAVVEAGTSQGMLDAYLRKHHPGLKHSLPDAPPAATIAGNIAIHGSGHLSQSEGGFHSEMVTGLEAVLGTGEVVKLGSCSTVPAWFSRAPLPDLVGLFLGWNGTTGIITKVGIKLFPRPRFHDVLVYMTEDIDLAPVVINRVIGTSMAEDINYAMAPKPDYLRGFQMTVINYTANTEQELTFKRNALRSVMKDLYETRRSGFMPVPPNMKSGFLEAPQKALSKFADVRKGGGFEYVGAIIPVEKIPDACRAGMDITARHGITYSLGARIIGRGHAAMFFFAYPFNRVDRDEVERVKHALDDTNGTALALGGIPWKTEVQGQRLIMDRMDPATKELMKRVRGVLDPAGIMNPGNWEVA